MVREDVRLAPDDGDAVGLRAERALEPEVLLVGAPELVQKVPQRRLAVSAKLSVARYVRFALTLDVFADSF